MNADLENAKRILEQTGCTCVLCKDGRVWESRARGVSPLMEFLSSGQVPAGFSAADKVVGKATAFLYCLLGAKAVYAPVMSRLALQVLEDHGIEAHFAQCVDAIFNRRRDGFCPMETATKELSDPDEALAAIRQVLEKLH